MKIVLIILNLAGGNTAFLDFTSHEACQSARSVLAEETRLGGNRSLIRTSCVEVR